MNAPHAPPHVPPQMPPSRRLRVLVCGTTFGRIYLRGLALLPYIFELAGILARGSAHSAATARALGVPLYTSADDLPDGGIDAACVVVRSAVVGGSGSELARALLERGIHVLQEHPVHHDELAACLRTAQRSGCIYRLNGFYPDVEPVARFIRLARLALARREAVYVDAACSVHVLYPLVDILGQALGGFRPWSFGRVAEMERNEAEEKREEERKNRPAPPFLSLSGTLAGIPLSLRVQNQIDPGDPDNHTHVLHRIVLGTSGGALTLTDTHGLVLWSPRLHVGRDDGVLDLSGSGGTMDLPSTSIVGPAGAASYGAVFTDLWPRAIARALSRFHEAILAGTRDARIGQHHLTACRVWQDIGNRIGPARIVSPPAPVPLSLAEIELDEKTKTAKRKNAHARHDDSRNNLSVPLSTETTP